MNALVRAALSNKALQILSLSADCPNQLLEKALETDQDSGAGPSAFEALLLPGHSAITTLQVHRWPLISPRDAQILASDSPTLQTLILRGLDKSNRIAEWLVKFLRLLESNTSLHDLAILNSPGADVPEVYEALMQLLDRTSGGALQGVELWCSGQFAHDERNEALRRRLDAVQCKRNQNGAQWALRNFPRVKPSSIRIFFCGFPFAGKTTLRRNMVNVLQQRSSRSHFNIACQILPQSIGVKE
ncbi:hypothetical protein GOP47_0006012 [Adiantum capillus-veneris]|uniref:Uncharacterized protein n=1 Tax=Adiantum capillus-veneris TaxID=13818 RepID=A0A9D4ZM56_ADICA|nr:hypothetical protein GOP47_0006012 [Adiantum capillus-veneris]